MPYAFHSHISLCVVLASFEALLRNSLVSLLAPLLLVAVGDTYVPRIVFPSLLYVTCAEAVVDTYVPRIVFPSPLYVTFADAVVNILYNLGTITPDYATHMTIYNCVIVFYISTFFWVMLHTAVLLQVSRKCDIMVSVSIQEMLYIVTLSKHDRRYLE